MNKRTFKLVITISIVVLIAIFTALWFKDHTLDPRDYFYTDYVQGLTDYKVITGTHTYTALNINDPESITALFDYPPFPPYVPEGYSLVKAELIDQDEGDGRNFKAVIRLRYEDDQNPDDFFLVIMAEGTGLITESDYRTHNTYSADPASYSGHFLTFADHDLCIYKFMGSQAYFSKFEFADRIWTVHFENVSKHNIRLIITSIFTQSGDVD
ncbi:MAG TPA: hypothetical protein PK629_06950 [Oscillospiraceae bacterium]|nr:hypothetical protein [Oscillospiraceae bacterium]HPK34684.1 hypothetical protein [Oscillospiraceae bacterium]HPR74552.1 hypothetical protein [Oscillospiraceae bacterium]